MMQVYINGVLQRYTDYAIGGTILKFNHPPRIGSQISVNAPSGWQQGFVGDGKINYFILSEKMAREASDFEHTEIWECRQILQQLNEQLTDPRLQEEIRRLGTFANMLKEYQ